MEITNSKHLVFIKEMATHGDRGVACMTAYPRIKSKKVAHTNAGRLLKNAEIKKAIAKMKTEITSLANQNIAAQVSDRVIGEVLSFNRKREILAGIANGTYLLPKKVLVRSTRKGGGWIEKTVMAPPSQNDVVKAVELDNRMTGDFASDKRELSLTTPAQKTEALSDDKFSQLIDTINKKYFNGKDSANSSPGIQPAT